MVFLIKRFLLAIVFALVTFIPQSHAGDIKIFVNGREVQSEVPPVINNGTTLVPIRMVSEALGAKVNWEPDTGSIFISGQTAVALRLNSKWASVDGKQTELIQAPINTAGRTMVPVRLIAEAFGCNVRWEDGKVLIQKESPSVTQPKPQGEGITDTVLVNW